MKALKKKKEKKGQGKRRGEFWCDTAILRYALQNKLPWGFYSLVLQEKSLAMFNSSSQYANWIPVDQNQGCVEKDQVSMHWQKECLGSERAFLQSCLTGTQDKTLASCFPSEWQEPDEARPPTSVNSPPLPLSIHQHFKVSINPIALL